MDELEGNMSSEDVRSVDSSSAVKKPKKRSLVERELETNMTARITSPITDGLSTSRYGRARRLKSDYEITKTPQNAVTPGKSQSPAYKMHASNSPCKKEKNESYLDNQIDNIYQENISLSRFSNESSPSPAKKFPKVYTRKDLIQNREADETIMLIKNLFSPTKSSKTPNSNTDLSTFELSEKKAKQNGHVDNASVVKTLDFDGKKKGQSNDQKVTLVSKNDLFELEAKCPYKVGDLAWARMGTFPFWPCIVTGEPSTDLFVKKKMFGRVEREIIHVTFLGDNGRRSWIVDNMLQHYLGLQHFEETKEKFTAEDKKKDPKLYAAYFISEKKQPLWSNSVEEAETLMREPKRLRIDVFNDMLWKSQASKKPKSGKICRTDSDVSLSESLYDSLFSEDDKSDDPEKSKSKSRNKSFDVSDVVTACLDNMAAKTGITKIQKQSHMDRWLQKAKSNTPEKIQVPQNIKLQVPQKVKRKSSSKTKKKPSPKASQSTMRLRKSNDSLPSLWNTKNSSEDDSKNDNSSKRVKKVNIEKNDVENGESKINDTNKKAEVIVIDDDSSHSVEKKDDQEGNKVSEIETNKKDIKDEVNIEVTDTKINNKLNNAVENMDQDTSINDINKTKKETHQEPDNSVKELNDTVEKMDQNSSINDMIATNGDAHEELDDSVHNGQEINSNVEPKQNVVEVNEKDEITANDANMKADTEKVSKESVEAIVKLPNINETSMKVEQIETGMKDFTNEASVTESKNTINIQADEGPQESSKPEKQQNNTNSNIDFLDISKSTEISADKYLQDSTDTNYDKNKVIEEDFHNKSTKDDHKLMEKSINSSISNFGNTDKINSCDINYLDASSKDLAQKELLNKSSNSESILECDNIKNDLANSSMESNRSISTLEDGQMVDPFDKELENSQMSIDQSDTEMQILTISTEGDNNQTKEENGSTFRTYVESPTFTQDIDSDITDLESEKAETTTDLANSDKVNDKVNLEDRTYAESPTFTQLLESEEFFRDVNEECDSKNKSQNLTNEAIENLINEPECDEMIDHKIQNDVVDSRDKTRVSKTIKNLNGKHDTYKNNKLKDRQTDSKLIIIDGEDDTHSPNKHDKHELFLGVVDKSQHNDTLINSKIQTNIKSTDKKHSTHISCQNNEYPNKSVPDKNEKSDKVTNNIEDVYENGDDEDEESDDPSPEYESLDEDITEDFRKHMQSIENNIKDKKDVEQIVKICNEIAEKAKLSPTKYVDLACENKNVSTVIKKEEELNKVVNNESKAVKGKKITSVNEIQINLTEKIELCSEKNTSKNLVDKDVNEKHDNSIKMNGDATEKEVLKVGLKTRSKLSLKTKRSPEKEAKKREREPKVIISPLKLDPNLKITNKSIIEVYKSSKSKKKLSLNKSPKSEKLEKSSEKQSVEKIQEINEVIPVMKELNMTKLEEVNKNIQQPILNGYHKDTDKKLNENDKDFNIDTVSINSEDSEDSVQEVPRRILRSRPEVTLEFALKSPDFLKYLELKQDYLMDEHPELNDQQILSYVYKTWQYELKSDYKNEESHFVKVIRDTPRKRPKKEPKNRIDNYFRDEYDKCSKTIDFESKEIGTMSNDVKLEPKLDVESQEENSTQHKNNINNEESDIVKTNIENKSVVKSHEDNVERTRKSKRDSKRKSDSREKSDSKNKIDTKENAKKLIPESPKLPISIDITDDDIELVKDKYKDLETVSIKSEESSRKSLRSRTSTPKILVLDPRTEKIIKEEDTESIDSDNSEINLRQLRSKVLKEKVHDKPEESIEILNTSIKEEIDDGGSTISDNEPLLRRKKKVDKSTAKSLEDPEFIKYMELRQDAIMDENPELTESEIVQYLHKTWLYEESSKSEIKKNEELEQANLVKGCNEVYNEPKKSKRKPKPERSTEDSASRPKVETNSEETVTRDKPRRKTIQPLYNEEFYSDIEEELEVFEIFKHKKTPITVVSKSEEKSPKNSSKIDKDVEIVETKPEIKETPAVRNEQAILDEIELYFTELAKPKPSVFKGLIRERVCDICEREGSLIKCKSCHGMFHTDCVKKQQQEIIEIESLPLRGRKKKKKLGRKPKSLDSELSDDKSQDASMESVEFNGEIVPDIAFDAETFESQLEDKMRKMLDNVETHYDSYSSDDGIDWEGTVAGKCEIVDVKLKKRTPPLDFSDFRCNNCLKHEMPLCFVCRSAISKTEKKLRQKCVAAQCNKYYHLECLDHWPQTQFNSGESSKNKKVNEFSETLTCPRHVCHTCVSDDPRGCKTRFSADKLAKCVRCPATYHSFNKCLPAGTQVLTASQIICPRHYEQKPGKVSCHVNTGWCFICAEGGSLICCEYCPTSFHAECLNIKPPEGNYMCEDCETGRLPLYGEMVWVKLGHYRWWPGIILHPSEIPENLFLMKHGIGEFVVRFFGQYDHYWVNRGRVFPYQEGDSGRISSQKSKIDAAFTTAIEHAQRAYEILKNADTSNDEESQDIASSLLPPHYVKLKSNKPSGSLCGRRVEDPSLSLTACECDPTERDPCGPYSHCLNRMLLTECGPTCRTGDRCNNRAFEKRLYPKLVPYRTPHRGWGLKTLEDIKAGQFVIEYVGELIDEEEFRRRMRRKHEIRDENYYFLTLDKERMIDAGPKGNLARFMNHCCEPNCETQKWTVLGDIRVGLFAIDDIPANTEVTFNYKLECDGIEKKRCLCGAKRCSGYIGAKLKQDESQSKKGKNGKVKRPYNKKKKLEDSPSTTKNKPKRPLGRPPKPKELTEIEKDLLIINNASNGISSDESKKSVENQKSLKRKRSTEDILSEPSVKKVKCEVGD